MPRTGDQPAGKRPIHALIRIASERESQEPKSARSCARSATPGAVDKNCRAAETRHVKRLHANRPQSARNLFHADLFTDRLGRPRAAITETGRAVCSIRARIRQAATNPSGRYDAGPPAQPPFTHAATCAATSLAASFSAGPTACALGSTPRTTASKRRVRISGEPRSLRTASKRTTTDWLGAS